MQFLASLIPALTPEFVRFADDYIVLQPLSREQLTTPRALEDLNQSRARGHGAYKELVWLTYDVLKHYDFPGYNFEAHVPQPLSKRLCLEAFIAFREFLSEDRLKCVLTLTSMYNYAIKHHGLEFEWMDQATCRAGFYSSPPSFEVVREKCHDRLFLNFNDTAWGPGIEQFLREQFPLPSKYERVDALEAVQASAQQQTNGKQAASTSTLGAPVKRKPLENDNEALTRAFSQAIASRGQMSPSQYFRIAVELLRRGPCKLLVLGAGRDTELYVRANSGGRTAVLERHAAWIDQIRHLECETAAITYSTRLADDWLEDCPLPGGIPQSILEEKWDVVLVDGPEGNRGDAPGRQQSIFLASQLADAGSTVFLHDYNRRAENVFAKRYFGDADEIHGR